MIDCIDRFTTNVRFYISTQIHLWLYIQCTLKYLRISDLKFLIDAIKFIEDTYKKQPLNLICVKYANISCKVVKIIVVIHASILIQLIAYPIVWYLIFGKLELAFEIYLPYVDHKTLTGSGIVVVVQIIGMICFWMMNGSYDLLMILITRNVPMVSEIIFMDID